MRVTGDGDCFFYSVAAHRRYLEQGIPTDWVRSPYSWGFGTDSRVRYHRDLAPDAKKIRHAVAAWAAAQIFGIDSKEFPGLCDALLAEMDDGTLAALKDPVFNAAVPWACFAECFQIQEDWQAWKPEERVREALFYLYWLWQTNDEIEDNEGWAGLCKEFGFNKPLGCLYVDCDPHYPVATTPASGLAFFAVNQIYGVTLAVAIREEIREVNVISLDTLQEGNMEFPEYCFLYHNGHLHYEAIVWMNDVVDEVAERQFFTEKSFDMGSSSAFSKPTTRHIDNTVRSPWLVGVGVWNVNHLGGQDSGHLDVPNVLRRSSRNVAKVDYSESRDIEEPTNRRLSKEEIFDNKAYRSSGVDDSKNRLKIQAIGDLIANNSDWLDLLALNEVNKGVDRLAYIPGAAMHPGPHMMSIGPACTIGQHEYYPLFVIDRKRNFTLDYHSCFAVDYNGKKITDDQILWMKQKHKDTRRRELERSAPKPTSKKSKKTGVAIDEFVDVKIEKDVNKRVRWTTLPSYRPVVVHRLKVDTGSGNPIWLNVGVVHTTPGGMEFERFEVYSQLETFFHMAASHDYDEKGGLNLWIVAGDYYLLGESLVKSLDEAPDTEEVIEACQELIDDLKRAFREVRGHALQTSDVYKNLPKSWRSYAGWVQQQPPPEEPKPSSKDKKRKRPEDPRPALTSFALGYLKMSESALSGLKQMAEDIEGHEALQDDSSSSDEQSEDGTTLFRKATRLLQYHSEVTLKLTALCGELDHSNDMLGRQQLGEQPKTSSISGSGNVVPIALTAPTVDDDEDEQDEHLNIQGLIERNNSLAKTLRHRIRNLCEITFEGQVKPLFNVIQTIWGTNLHGEANLDPTGAGKMEYTYLRLADFVVCSKEFQTVDVGLFLNNGKLTRVDDDKLTTCLYWRALSDHFPIGGRFSLASNDLAVRRVFVDQEDTEKMQARLLLYLLDFDEGVHNQRARRDGEQIKTLKAAFRSSDFATAFKLIKQEVLNAIAIDTFPEEYQQLLKIQLDSDPEEVQALLTKVLKPLRAMLMMANTKKKESEEKNVEVLELSS